MRGSRIRPTYANVVATVALFVALGGTAIATHPGGQNTISTADIQNGEVKVADVGQGAVATDEIANGQVKAADIGDGEVRTAEIANGQVLNADIGAGEVRSSNVANDNLTGGDIATNSLKGVDIDESTLSNVGGGGPAGGDLTGTYPNPLIAPNAVGDSEVIDGSLNDEDIGQGTFVAFDGNIGNVPANDCVDREVSGVNARLDHVVLAPDWNNADSDLFYSVLNSSQTGTLEGFVMIRVCNPTAVDQNDGTTRFNLLVIDAQ